MVAEALPECNPASVMALHSVDIEHLTECFARNLLEAPEHVVVRTARRLTHFDYGQSAVAHGFALDALAFGHFAQNLMRQPFPAAAAVHIARHGLLNLPRVAMLGAKINRRPELFLNPLKHSGYLGEV